MSREALLTELHSRLGLRYQQVRSNMQHDYIPAGGDIFIDLIGSAAAEVGLRDAATAYPIVQFIVPVIETPEREGYNLDLAVQEAGDQLQRLIALDGIGIGDLPWAAVRRDSWEQAVGDFANPEGRSRAAAKAVIHTQTYTIRMV